MKHFVKLPGSHWEHQDHIVLEPYQQKIDMTGILPIRK